MLEELGQAILQFQLLRPYWLLAIIPALALTLLLFYKQITSGSWQSVINPAFQPYLLSGESQNKNITPFYLLALGWIITCIALAGPTWKQLPQVVHKKVDARVIILDQSFSMKAGDIKPDRNTRAKHKLVDLLKRFKEGTTALIVYAGDAHVVTPLTDDIHTVTNLVPALSPDIMPIPGSNPLAAIEQAKKLFENSAVNNGEIFLITDGVEQAQVDAIQSSLDTNRIRLHVLGVGTQDGAPIPLPDGSFLKDQQNSIVLPKLNIGPLRRLARNHQGIYTSIRNSDQDINRLTRRTEILQPEQTQQTSRQFDLWREEGPWLILLLIPLAALAFRKGWLAQFILPSLVLFFCAPSNPTQASIWQDLWATADQQGAQAFTEQDYQTAAEKFKSNSWKGSALYRNQQFEQAAEQFAQNQDFSSYYNQGTALAKAGQFQQALDAYQKALELNPENDDLQHNIKVVEQLLKQQQSSQSQEQQNQQQDNSQQQQSQSQDSNQNQQQNSQQQNAQQQNQNSQPQDHQQLAHQQLAQGSQQNQQDSEPPQSQAQSGHEENNQQEKEQQSQLSQQQKQEQQSSDQSTTAQPEQLQKQGQNQALQQWLRRVPDDPGGLLRNKFYLESQKNKQQSAPSDKIW